MPNPKPQLSLSPIQWQLLTQLPNRRQMLKLNQRLIPGMVMDMDTVDMVDMDMEDMAMDMVVADMGVMVTTMVRDQLMQSPRLEPIHGTVMVAMEAMVAMEVMEAMEVMDTEVMVVDTEVMVIIMERGQLMPNLKQKPIHGTVMVDMEGMDMVVMDMVAMEVMEDMGVMVIILARGLPMPNLKHGVHMVAMEATVAMEAMDTMDKGECYDHHYINHHCPT